MVSGDASAGVGYDVWLVGSAVYCDLVVADYLDLVFAVASYLCSVDESW